MALRIRLRRMGRRNAPTYRIVVAESSMPRDGRIVESIGHYNPRTEPLTLQVDRAKALYWIGQGATPTDTTKALLKRAGVFRPEAEGGVAEAVSAVAERVKDAAKKTARGARAAAGAAAEAVREAASDVRDAVAERVGGGEEAAADEGADAAADTSLAAEEAAPAAEAEVVAEPEAEAEPSAAGEPVAEDAVAPAAEAAGDDEPKA